MGNNVTPSDRRRTAPLVNLRIFVFGSLAFILLLYMASTTLMSSYGTGGPHIRGQLHHNLVAEENYALMSKDLDGINPEEAGDSAKLLPAVRLEKSLKMPLNALKSLSHEERMKVLTKVRKGVALNPNVTNKHGLLGLDDDGDFFFKPKKYDISLPNGLKKDMAVLLRDGGGFNLELSDSVPLDRIVSDGRSIECKRIDYSRVPVLMRDSPALVKASVVIVFYNEPFSTLMRSVHSILNLTPAHLLEEIILVDDGSNMNWIRPNGSGELERYVELLPKVSLVRLPKRRGIVAARMAGIRAAKAPIFVILDSHIEVQPFWAEPLISRIAEDRTRVLMPQVDSMASEDLTYVNGGIGCTLGFLWKLIEHSYEPTETSPPERRKAGPADFITSPTMAGGLFAANVDFFLNDIGGYDEELSFWGTENLELSFRLWLCGGTLECTRCSRVYHIFRKGGVGYSSPPWSTTINKLRVLSQWMGEYADLAWRTIGRPKVEYGDVSKTLEWKKEKQCKDFQYFMDEVWPESVVRNLTADVPYLGSLKHAASPNSCLDLSNDEPGKGLVRFYPCHSGNSQSFMHFSKVGRIMPTQNDECCMAIDGSTFWCEHKRHPFWEIIPATTDLAVLEDNGSGNVPQKSREVLIKDRQTGRCLGAQDSRLVSKPCTLADLSTHWHWDIYKPVKTFTPPPDRFKPRS